MYQVKTGDRDVARLTPDANVALDASLCIVVRTPERRITVTDVEGWVDALREAKVFQQIYAEEAERSRRDVDPVTNQTPGRSDE